MEQSNPNPNPTQEIETQPTKQIFILSGQSNMAGRGGVNHHKHWDRVVPPQCSPDPTKIHRLNSHLHWESAHEPLHFDIDTKKTCGVGPGMSFANAVKDLVHGVIGLVPCAIGGTAIKEWGRETHLYKNMVRRSKVAAVAGEIKALLWYQGESDTLSEQDANCYKDKMEELIANIRADLSLPDLPVIQVAIASGDDKFMETVRKSQLEMDIQNVVCVDAKGLQLKEDNLHLTTEAQVLLGQMLAQAYINHFVC